MGLFDRRRPPRVTSPNDVTTSLTAAGERVTGRKAEENRRLLAPWQARAFTYYDILGEIKYAAQFYARGLSMLELFAAEKDSKGEIVATENEQAIAALDRIQDPGGGRSGLLGAYGRLMFLVGEANLFVSREDEVEQWEMLSTDELRVNPGGAGYVRYRAPQLAGEEFREPTDKDWTPVDDDKAVTYRLWQRHPRYSSLADSTMAGVLDLCEELVLLTQAVRARARSRTAGNGILFIDDSITVPASEAAPDEDVEEDLFMKRLIEAMIAPMQDEGSASAVVPLLIRVPVPDDKRMADLVYHLELVDPTQLYPETGLRYEIIKRIALGLDMPPEILLGLEGANHWTAWQVDEQTWKGHLQPKAQQLVDDLTAAYFRPQLKEDGLADWEKYSIAYDAAAIVNHPDKAKDAKDLHKEGAIGDKALREAAGFDEDDAPTEEERRVWISIRSRDPQFAITGIPSPVRNRGGDDTPDDDDEGAQRANEVDPGPPEEPAERNGNGAVPEGLEASLRAARVLGAADLALLRAREAAGNRILSIVKRDPEAAEICRTVATGSIAAALGPERLRALKVPPERELVAGVADLIRDALRVFGITDQNVITLVAEHVERHALLTLYDETSRGFPPQFVNYVTSVLAGVK